jgi:hypothetical protein
MRSGDDGIWLEIGWDKNRKRIEALQDRIGVREIETAAWATAATPDAVRHFALGIGDANLRWLGQGGMHAVPPSFFYAAGPRINATRCPAADGWQWTHAAWRWHAPLAIGQAIVATSWVEAIDEALLPGGGGIHTVRHRAEFHAADGALLAEVETRETSCPIGVGYVPPAAGPPFAPWHLDDLVDIYSVYAAEAPRIAPRSFDEVAVGDTLPTLAKGPIGASATIAYLQGIGGLAVADRLAWQAAQARPYEMTDNVAGVPETQDRVHWDGDFARLRGLPGASPPSSARSCWLIHQVTDWMGDGAILREADCTIDGLDREGDALLIHGEVVDRFVRDGRHFVRIAQRMLRRDRSVSASGAALVEFPAT